MTESSDARYRFENDFVCLLFERHGDVFAHRVIAKEASGEASLNSLAENLSPQAIATPPLRHLRHRSVAGGVEVEVTGEWAPHRFTALFTLPASAPYVHVRITDDLQAQVELEYFESCYRLGRDQTDFLFAPTIRPYDDHVIGEPSFKVPVLIVQQGDAVLALVADMAHMRANRNALRYCLELEADPRVTSPPVLGFGLKDHEPDGLLYYRHTPEMQQRVGPGRLSFAYYVLAAAKQPPRLGYRTVMRFLWERFGQPGAEDAPALPAPVERYAHYGIDYALRHLWVDLPVGERQFGAVMSGIRYPDDIWFHSLFNNLTGGYAFHHFGQRLERPDWARRATAIRDLILSAPAVQGIFPTVLHSQVRYARREMRWVPSSHWMLTEGMDDACVTYQKQNFSKVIDWERLYSTTQCSYTANWLLRWHREVAAHAPSVAFCRRYGEFLVAHQARSGAIPTFFAADTLRPDQILLESAETACSAMFLAHLAVVTGEPRFLRAAQTAEAYLAEQIVPTRKWQDHETYFDSCGKPIAFWDPHSRQYAQSTQCVSWAAEMYRLLAEATGADRYLDAGLCVLDYLSLFQQIWQAPFCSIPTFGGFAVGNGHAAWNDARQGLFSPIYVKYAQRTGIDEYFLRGVAAAKAGLPLVFAPENAKLAPGIYDKGPLGHADENYAHRGEDRPALIGYCFDFQVGASLAALAYIQKHYGEVR